jgi:hypothetical protein
MSNEPQHVKLTYPKKSFLLEERIDVPDSAEFTKYVHNGSALPNLDETDEEYHTALFLCAVQHLQYVKSQRCAYVSDFQGFGGLLTDAQVMTSPWASLTSQGVLLITDYNFLI